MLFFQLNPLFIVARSFDINRPGTFAKDLHGGVLGGTLKRGVLKVGDEIEIKPGLVIKEKNQIVYETVKTKIASIYRGSYPVTKATSGGSLSIETTLDSTLTKGDRLSGCLASLIGELPENSSNLKIKASLFSELSGTEKREKIEDFKLGELLMLSVNTSITVGKINNIDKDNLSLSLNIPVISFKGDSLGIARNINNHWRLIGVGKVI